MAESKPKMRRVDEHSGNASTTVQAASGCGSSSRSSADDILQLVGSKLRKEDALIGNFPIGGAFIIAAEVLGIVAEVV